MGISFGSNFFSSISTVSQAAALLGILTPPTGRLTLTTATPVLTATVSGAASIIYTPYIGAVLPIFDGTNLVPTAFTELSNSTTASSVGNAGPAAVANNSAYDLFVWNNAGVITLTRGPAWSSLTARSAGTALVRQNGILLNSVAITNGPGALRGTYVGTVASNGTATIDYIFGAVSSGGTAARFGIWNCYNRVSTATNVTDSNGSYTYTSATIRQANASAGNQIAFLLGLAEDGVPASYSGSHQFAAAVSAALRYGLGLDNTAAFSLSPAFAGNPVALGFVESEAPSGTFSPGIGLHTISANEQGDGVNANTFNSSSLNTLSAVIRN